MPTIAAHADLTASNPRSAPFNSPPADSSMGFDVTVSPPLFDGGRTDASVRMAKASAQTERERVRGQEQELLLTAIAVYADVIMNRRLISVYERAASQWKQMVEATRQQMAVKEAAVADVAQADAALAGAVAQVVLARANLSASEAAFLEIFQHPPAVLEQAPGVELLLPRSEKAAAEANERFSPDIAIAIAQKQAAFHAIDRANADRLPVVSLQGGYRQRTDATPLTPPADGAFAMVVATVPLYSGGLVEANVAEARPNHNASAHQLDDARARSRAVIARAWSQMVAARAALASLRLQHAANQKAVAAVVEEHRIGQRSLVDVVNARQAAIASETALEQSKRNSIVNDYAVLQLTGKLTAETIAATLGKGGGEYLESEGEGEFR